MSWEAARKDRRRVDLAGPVGDTLKLSIRSSSPEFTWTGWSWVGQVRAKAGSSVVSTFTITDSSTPTALALVATVADTSAWRVGERLEWAIQGTKAGETFTWFHGTITPTPNLVL